MGLFFLCLLSGFGFLRIMNETPVSAHFRVFTASSEALWNGIIPYGKDFGIGVGQFFYSPACGLFVFGIFDLFPPRVGMALYVLLSFFLFLYGTKKFAQSISLSKSQVQWFYFLAAPQVFSAILATKLELLIAGFLFFSFSLILAGKNNLAASILGMLLNWKFQPLPTVGLLWVGLMRFQGGIKFGGIVLLSLSLWFLLPLIFLTPQTLYNAHRIWMTELSGFVQNAWSSFDNIYTFLRNTLGINWTYSTWSLLAILFGFFLTFISFRTNSRESALYFAIGSGALFTATLSPLGQNNAFVLYTPLIALALKLNVRWVWIFLCWFIMAFAYSDLVPTETRNVIRNYTVKPVAPFILWLPIIRRLINERRIAIR